MTRSLKDQTDHNGFIGHEEIDQDTINRLWEEEYQKLRGELGKTDVVKCENCGARIVQKVVLAETDQETSERRMLAGRIYWYGECPKEHDKYAWYCDPDDLVQKLQSFVRSNWRGNPPEIEEMKEEIKQQIRAALHDNAEYEIALKDVEKDPDYAKVLGIISETAQSLAHLAEKNGFLYPILSIAESLGILNQVYGLLPEHVGEGEEP